jgi:AcrR family transcriptional regulator
MSEPREGTPVVANTTRVTGPAFFAEVEPGRKGEILDSALCVFAERGYDNGSMREIAKGVGVSEPALYRHFPGKEALFLALIRAGAGRMRREAFALIDDLQPDTLREQLLAMFDNRRRALRLNGPMLRAVIPAAARNAAFLEAFRSAIATPVLSRITEKSVELDAAFDVPDAHATRDVRVRALFSLIVGGFLSSMVLADRPDEAIADAALRVMGWERSS